MTHNNEFDTMIIGGGAAGMVSAISNQRKGGPAALYEKTSQIGKKLLASGNGRCNLLNEQLDVSCFNPSSREIVTAAFSKFGRTKILDFFKQLGLETYSKEGRIFPVTNQAASVLKVLVMELKRLSIPIEFGYKCVEVEKKHGGIFVRSESRQTIKCKNLVLTGGGRSYPSYGSDGSIYDVIRQLGHSIIEPVPCAVPLVVKDPLCSALQGQRIMATAKSFIGGKSGDPVAGELLFTKYGLSGTCILDVSEDISIALNRYHTKNVYVTVDLAPFMDHDRLHNELVRRKKRKTAPEDMLVGILPNKISSALKNLFSNADIQTAIDEIKNRRFKIESTRGWNEAEFTAGGVSVDEINPLTLESRLHKGVYFAGEVLDVNGRRGGFNLGWAWASGYIAGRTGNLKDL